MSSQTLWISPGPLMGSGIEFRFGTSSCVASVPADADKQMQGPKPDLLHTLLLILHRNVTRSKVRTALVTTEHRQEWQRKRCRRLESGGHRQPTLNSITVTTIA